MPLRLALADDQALVRSGLAALLDGFSQLQVQVQAADGAALLAAIETSPVDVILSDIRMPGLDGFALLAALRAAGNPTPVILLTTFDEPELALRAAEAGARGFLLKDASPEDLLDAVTRVAGGETLLAPVSTDPVRARYAYRDTSVPTDTFSEREVAILRLLAGGYSNKENRPRRIPVGRHGKKLRFRHPRQTRHPRPHPRRAQGHHPANHLIFGSGCGSGLGRDAH